MRNEIKIKASCSLANTTLSFLFERVQCATLLQRLMPAKEEIESYLESNEVASILTTAIQELINKHGTPPNPLQIIGDYCIAVASEKEKAQAEQEALAREYLEEQRERKAQTDASLKVQAIAKGNAARKEVEAKKAETAAS